MTVTISVGDHVCPACWRYGSPEMREIFSEKRKLSYSLGVEAALAEAEADLGIIPAEAAAEIRRKATTAYVTPEAVFEREKTTRHDVMAMVQILTEACEGDAGRYVHLGATSYDIEDNRLALQVREASGIIGSGIAAFGSRLKARTEQYRGLASIGRTHTQWAEPMTFGHKLAKHLYDVFLDYGMFKDFRGRWVRGKPMTGAVGTAASFVHLAGQENAARLGPMVMERLGLNPALITDQIVSRKFYARAGECLTQTAMTGCRFAQELYDLWRPEIAEVAPRQPKIGVVGSSAMPHKTVLMNDIDGENIMSLARVVKALSSIAYDNIPTRHERDLTQSAAERIWIPQAFIYTDEILRRCASKAKDMVVDEKRIGENLRSAARFTVTEPLMMELTKRGLGRQQAHELLQKYTLRVWEDTGVDPVDALMEMGEIGAALPREDAQRIIDEHVGYTGNSVSFVGDVLDAVNFEL